MGFFLTCFEVFYNDTNGALSILINVIKLKYLVVMKVV